MANIIGCSLEILGKYDDVKKFVDTMSELGFFDIYLEHNAYKDMCYSKGHCSVKWTILDKLIAEGNVMREEIADFDIWFRMSGGDYIGLQEEEVICCGGAVVLAQRIKGSLAYYHDEFDNKDWHTEPYDSNDKHKKEFDDFIENDTYENETDDNECDWLASL